MGDREDEIPEMSSPPQEVVDLDSNHVYDPSPEISSHFGYDPSFTGHWYWLPGDENHYEPTRTSHVRYDMPDLTTPNRHIMSRQKLNLTLCLGELLFLSMWRYLGALVTLHLPSRWWRLPHMSVLDLVLVVIYGYQNQDK